MMQISTRVNWADAVRIGLLGAVIVVYMSLVGMVALFGARSVVVGIISLGHMLLVLVALGAGVLSARRALNAGVLQAVLAGAVTGAVTGAGLALLVIIGNLVNLRAVLLNASPALYSLLTLGQGLAGAWIPLVAATALGALAALTYRLPVRVRAPLAFGFFAVVVLGLFAGLLRVQMIASGGVFARSARYLFGTDGLTRDGALIVFLVTAGVIALWGLASQPVRTRVEALPTRERVTLRIIALAIGVVVVLWLPQASGPFVAQVIVLLGLYALMGLGLNLELGFAGLLDLGFVAFFAIGAYTVGILTSLGQYGIANWSFWAAVPVAVLMALIAGVLLGVPVLGIRGDYLAIATLGFGEITRLLVQSDFMAPMLGGSQGVLQIPKPAIGGFVFAGPQQIYYLVIASALLVAFVAWRLRDSRLGRTWMAIREDEDVAEALGINLFQSKLLAYGLGATFAGLSGTIFAVMTSSVYPHSMQLLVSINVVAVIVVGGMGSIPGVVIGALVLIGLPELFREFNEYRFLFYGVALIATMLYRPEGLWPSRTIQRELHGALEAEEEHPGATATPPPSATTTIETGTT
jgi:branched-chain amino acid transport system permease protein